MMMLIVKRIMIVMRILVMTRRRMPIINKHYGYVGDNNDALMVKTTRTSTFYILHNKVIGEVAKCKFNKNIDKI